MTYLKATPIDKVWVDHGSYEAEYRIDKIECVEPSYNGSPEQRFYDSADWRNELLDQIDAVNTLTDPDVGTSLGLTVLEAVRICTKIDPDIGATTAEELITTLKERVDAEQEVVDQALADMAAYPEETKSDVLPDLQERYEELYDRLEDMGDIKVDLKPIETVREIIKTERHLNDMYSLVMAHK